MQQPFLPRGITEALDKLVPEAVVQVVELAVDSFQAQPSHELADGLGFQLANLVEVESFHWDVFVALEMVGEGLVDLVKGQVGWVVGGNEALQQFECHCIEQTQQQRDLFVSSYVVSGAVAFVLLEIRFPVSIRFTKTGKMRRHDIQWQAITVKTFEKVIWTSFKAKMLEFV